MQNFLCPMLVFRTDNDNSKTVYVLLAMWQSGRPLSEQSVAVMISANKSAKVEFAAKVVPITEEIKAAGVQTLRGICECLNRRGIATRNGKNWYPATVRNILKIQAA